MSFAIALNPRILPSAIENFKSLPDSKKVAVLALTFFAFLLTLPLCLGYGAIPTFILATAYFAKKQVQDLSNQNIVKPDENYEPREDFGSLSYGEEESNKTVIQLNAALIYCLVNEYAMKNLETQLANCASHPLWEKDTFISYVTQVAGEKVHTPHGLGPSISNRAKHYPDKFNKYIADLGLEFSANDKQLITKCLSDENETTKIYKGKLTSAKKLQLLDAITTVRCRLIADIFNIKVTLHRFKIEHSNSYNFDASVYPPTFPSISRSSKITLKDMDSVTYNQDKGESELIVCHGQFSLFQINNVTNYINPLILETVNNK